MAEKKPLPEPLFFECPDQWRDWLAANHATETEAFVGFRKKATGLPTMTWSESVDEALCYGWIDGRANRIDETSHMLRFTPRRASSTWSAVNVAKVAKLTAEGRMQPAGMAAFEGRSAVKTGIYSFEQETVAFTPEQQAVFEADGGAYAYFTRAAAWYRKAATWWVISAKREETRRSRLARLIADSAEGRTLAHLTRDRK